MSSIDSTANFVKQDLHKRSPSEIFENDATGKIVSHELNRLLMYNAKFKTQNFLEYF